MDLAYRILIILTSGIRASLLQNCLAFVLLICSILNSFPWLLIWVFGIRILLFIDQCLVFCFDYCMILLLFIRIIKKKKKKRKTKIPETPPHPAAGQRKTTTLFRDSDRTAGHQDVFAPRRIRFAPPAIRTAAVGGGNVDFDVLQRLSSGGDEAGGRRGCRASLGFGRRAVRRRSWGVIPTAEAGSVGNRGGGGV